MLGNGPLSTGGAASEVDRPSIHPNGARMAPGWTAAFIRASLARQAQAIDRGGGVMRLVSRILTGTALGMLALLPAATSAQELVVAIFGG